MQIANQTRCGRALGLWVVLLGTSGAVIAGENVLLEAPVVVSTSSDADIFPESWRTAPILASGEILAESEHPRVIRILKHALAKYPAKVLETHLRHVYVLSELKYSGVSPSGTNSRTDVYLKVGAIEKGFTDGWIEDVFHAEFSSILLRNRSRDLDRTAWNRFNPEGFEYLGNGVDAIKQDKARLRPDEKLHAQGFLRQYSQSTLEHDFNAFAAALLMGRKELWTLAEQHPNLAGKLRLTMEFYHALDADWTEPRFRALVPK